MSSKAERFQKVARQMPAALKASAMFRVLTHGLAAHPVSRKRRAADVGRLAIEACDDYPLGSL